MPTSDVFLCPARECTHIAYTQDAAIEHWLDNHGRSDIGLPSPTVPAFPQPFPGNALSMIELAQLLSKLDDNALMLVLYHTFTMRAVRYWEKIR